MNEVDDPTELDAAKRLGVTNEALGGDWFSGYSPRNGLFGIPEGPWCHWVHLARLILAHDLTRTQMPEFHQEYDAPHIHSEHHPACEYAETDR